MPRKKTPESTAPAASVSVPSILQARPEPSKPMERLKPAAARKKTEAKAPAIASKTSPTKTKSQSAPTAKAPSAKAKKTAKAERIEPINGHSMLNLTKAVDKGSESSFVEQITVEEITAEQIAERAYFRWLERGCPMGSPEEDWLHAEQELGLAR